MRGENLLRTKGHRGKGGMDLVLKWLGGGGGWVARGEIYGGCSNGNHRGNLRIRGVGGGGQKGGGLGY